MTTHKILVGSYTNDISTLEFTPSEKPLLRVTSVTTIGHHPSWVTRSPAASTAEKTVVFTGLEQTDGKIIALEFDGEGKGQIVAETSAGGRDPCTLEVTKDGKELLVGNYSSGHTVTIPITPTSPYLPKADAYPTISTTGTGPRTDRQEASHPHQVYFASSDELLVPDLGADKTWRLARGSDGKWTNVGAIEYKPGSGPRHVLVHAGILYTVLELSSELSAHTLPSLPEQPKHIGSHSTLTVPPAPDMLCAEIAIAPANGSESARIYISNRNDPHAGGDTIAVFSLASASTPLKFLGEVRTGLKHVRGMSLDPTNTYLIAGGANSDTAKVYERAPDGEWLKEVAQVSIGAPTCFLWI